MASPNKALSLFLFLALAPLGAQEVAPLQLKPKGLPGHAFPFAGLEVTVVKYPGVSWGNVRQVLLSLHNPTAGFLPFDPEAFTLVGADGVQDALSGWGDVPHGSLETHSLPTARVRVAPGATLEQGYLLEHRVKAPAKLYLGERLVAEITD